MFLIYLLWTFSVFQPINQSYLYKTFKIQLHDSFLCKIPDKPPGKVILAATTTVSRNGALLSS